MAARLGGRAGLPYAEPCRRARRPTSATGTSWRCSRTRPGRSTWGTSSTTRWATSRPTCAAGRAGACCGRWASTRSGYPPRTRPSRRRPSARDHRALHRRHPRADEAARLGDRLGPRGLGSRDRLLPLDAVALPTLLRARPRLPQGCPGQLVPERPDGRRERARHRRPVLALRRPGGGAQPRAVVLPHHRVRRRAARVRPA